MMTIKTFLKPLAACSLVFFGSAVALPFEDGFEANALEPKDIKSISIDNAIPVMVKDVAVNANGLLTAKKDTGPTPPVPVCKPVPAGFTVSEKPWATLVGAPYPKSPSWLQPIGSWSDRTSSQRGGKPAAGRVWTAAFIADSGNHKIGWLGAQAIPSAGYGSPQSALQVYVAISPCRADLQSECSNRARASNLFYGPNAAVPACRVVAGQKYYLTVAMVPADLDPKKNTCSTLNASGGVLCDANFKTD